MGRHFRPARIYQTVKKDLTSHLHDNEFKRYPAWLKTLETIPPTEILTRKYAFQHTTPNPKAKKPRRLYRPTHIVYPEDELRKVFYKDHPWELARPRMILELDGRDAQYRDWSKGLRQPGMPLCGESVVQRQLWFMQEKNMPQEQAYDKVRREFYALRQEEEVERRIAGEEARMVGAYFGKSALQVGMEVEDSQFEHWKSWAHQENMRLVTADRNLSSTAADESSPDSDGVDEAEEARAA